MNLRSATARLLALALLTPFAAQAQFTPQNDPANLAGERVSPADPADNAPINHGTLALEQLLRKLRTRASFMLIVAHPDDEDNGMLTYLSRGKGARVATLTLNRGEGGQNLMSADFGDALGLIRTQELLLSDHYMGVDQFFGTEVDFGFSKTKEEAFSKWTHERVLYDAVRAIRLYRPLVIASVFIGEPSDGHGQHQVAGEIAQEAFKAAGDPNVFPDQIAAGLLPWQPLKVYARSPFGRIDEKGMYDYATTQYVPARFENYVTGKVTTTVPKANVIVPEGDTDPLLGGESYAQYGRQARSLQRSQIGGGGNSRGEGARGARVDVSYHRYGSMLHQPDGEDSGLESGFFDGIDTSLPGIATLAPEISGKLRPSLQRLDDSIAKAQQAFDPAKPQAITPVLHDSLAALDKFIAELQNPAVNDLPRNETFNLLHELKIKRVQLNNALVLANGITVSATAPAADSEGDIRSIDKAITVRLEAGNNADHDMPIASLSFDAAGAQIATDEHRTLAARSTWHGERTIESSSAYAPTRPYFSRPGIQQPFYNVENPGLRNSPQTPPALTVHAALDCDGVPLEIAAVVSNDKKTHRVVFVPPVSVSVATGQNGTRTRALPDNQQAFNVALTKRPADAPTKNETLLPSDGWKTRRTQGTTEAGEFQFQVTAPPVPRPPATLTGSVQTADGQAYTEGYRLVGYPGLTGTNYYTPATLRVVPVDVRTAPNLKIAYLPGTGDDVPAGLDQLGIHAHVLTLDEVTTGKLSEYDAIILGVRAYAAHPELAGKGSAPLIEYANNGGVIIAQYNNARFGNAEAPYPITVAASSGDHAHDVVDETAPVTILAPDSPILTWPNRITTADFGGWVEERGHSFAASWAPEYKALLSTHDPGQEPQQGGLLVAHTGKGVYVYLGLALYRQLPEGVPGSYRLLANLISAGRNPQLAASK